MQRITKSRAAIVVAALSLLAAAVATGAAAGAAQVDEDLTIHACAQKNNGQLRTVEDPAECNPSEVPVVWNIVGPEGPPGPPGPPIYDAGEGLNLTATTFSVEFAGTGDDKTVSRSDHTHAHHHDNLYWKLTGNGGTSAGTNFLGTTDNQPLELHVDGSRALRLEPTPAGPNVVGGLDANSISAGVSGATIAGGGTVSSSGGAFPNVVTDDYGAVGGGISNQAGDGAGTSGDRPYATVAGGFSNWAAELGSTVGGGFNNEASGQSATTSGGSNNVASGNRSFVGGGSQNTAGSLASTVSGGQGNLADAPYATVGGGIDNIANLSSSTVSGGQRNTASDFHATVGGGEGNAASADHATVAGGEGNTASADHATVGGGLDNLANAAGATVGGGGGNEAIFNNATVGGGSNNTADDWNTTVGGGNDNTASGQWATVGGGLGNSAMSNGATIAGGDGNEALGSASTVSGGALNTAGGDYAMVPGGRENSAGGYFSFAAGQRAKVASFHDGTFLWADSLNADFNSAAQKEFAARATGGVRFVTAVDSSGNPTAGARLTPGSSSWSTISDRAAKANFAVVDGRAVLEALASIPVESWNWKTQDASIRHIGPMAQDFYAAFGVGEDPTRISTVDADGVALAAIQGLYQEVQERDARIADLEARLSVLEEGAPQTGSAGSWLPWLLLGGLLLGWLVVGRRRPSRAVTV